MSILKIEHLKKTFGKFVAVNDLSMVIEPGEAVGFIGQNGAGKSTTMRSIAGLSKIDSGKITILGNDIETEPVEARRHLGYVPQDLALYRHLTGEEFLTLIGKIRELSQEDIESEIEHLLKLCDLNDSRNKLIREYSGGMARKIAMAGAFIGKPELVVLDESFVGLDPESTYKLVVYLKQYISEGRAILISSHILEMLHQLCTRFFILHHGECVADYSLSEVEELCHHSDTPNLTALYLQKTGQSDLMSIEG